MNTTKLELQRSSLQRTLGVTWNTEEDVFVMNVKVPNKLFSKRGVISVNNTIYDPCGIASPATLQGKLLQRKIIPSKETNRELMNYG